MKRLRGFFTFLTNLLTSAVKPKERKLRTRVRTCAIRFAIRLAALFVISVVVPCAWSYQQQTGNSQTAASPFRLISSTSGGKEATRGNQEVIADPRTVFHLPEDKQVFVVFELEGPLGAHHLQGRWRDPTGKIVSVGDGDMQTNTPRFFCYWSLTLPDSVTPGLWAIEVQVDGHPVGEHTFQILANPDTPPAPPSTSAVYQRAVASSVFIDSKDPDNQLIRQGSGFFIRKGMVLTAFQVIDGASSLGIELADGSQITTNQVLAWNRWQDWAILKVDAPNEQPLERAVANSWKVGDHCYLLDAPNGTGRTIENVGITGIQEPAHAGERLSTTWYGGPRTIGSPLLDAFGRVVGVLGGSLVPGIESVGREGTRAYRGGGQVPENLSGPLTVPISLIPEPSASQPTVLSELATQSQFIKPVVTDTQVMSGTLCRDYQTVHDITITALGATTEFSRGRDSLAAVFMWAPDKKVKSTIQLQIYDLDNRLVEQSRPAKIGLQPQITAYSGMKLPLTALAPGIYRVDLLVGDDLEWRAFFRIKE